MGISIEDFSSIGDYCLNNEIDVIIPGPEAPLCGGIVDYFRQSAPLKHIWVIGPDRKAAKLEGSKPFAKSFMQRHEIPTADFRCFSKAQRGHAIEYVSEIDKFPIVVKEGGLAAGKGVYICNDFEEAIVAVNEIFEGKFGLDAGHELVVEQFLSGTEVSIIVLIDAEGGYCILPSSKDYKRVGDGDAGPNTGGMGAISPVIDGNHELMNAIKDNIIERTLLGLIKENIYYQGFLYFGLMIVEGTPYVLEYNCRLGDPETEVILPLIKNFDDLIEAYLKSELAAFKLETSAEYSAGVFLCSYGYPEAPLKGQPISISLNKGAGTNLFFAGVKSGKSGQELFTNGGRVVLVQRTASTLGKALDQVYGEINQNEIVSFNGCFFRNDIGHDADAYLI